MPRIAQSTIEEVNSRIDMVSLVGEYTSLKQRGSDFWGCCPYHHEKTPSFHVIPDRKMCHCFGCGAGGGPINFYMEMEKTSFMEAVIALAKKCGVEVVYDNGGADLNLPERNKKDEYKDLYGKIADSFRYILTSTEEGAAARAYLEHRGMSPEMQEKFKIGFAPKDRYWLKRFLRAKNYSDEFLAESGLFSKNYPDIAFFNNRLIFPIFDRMGSVVAFGGRIIEGDGPKYLNSSELLHYHKKETLYAFNFAKHSFREKKSVILCEGYMDAIAYHQAEIQNAVATCGTALTDEQVKMLSSLVDTAYLSFDSDGAGQAATWKAILLFRRANMNVRIIRIVGAKDPDELLQKSGKEALTNCVNNAILDSDFLLSALSKKYNTQSPEGKTRATFEFFQYIDALQSETHKESCFEQLCRAYQLNPEAVHADYLKRSKETNSSDNSYRSTTESAPKTDPNASYQETTKNIPQKLVVDAELRAVLVAVANMSCYPMMRNSLTADDFENPAARDLFITLEECYREEAVSSDSILGRCENEELRRLIAKVVTSGEYAENAQRAMFDGIKILKQNSLIRKRQRAENRLRSIDLSGEPESQRLSDELLNEIMNINMQLKQLNSNS